MGPILYSLLNNLGIHYFLVIILLIKDDNLIKLYNLYDYTFLDEELSEISREIRVRQVKNMLDNNINEFIYHFGDFKTADMWINMPWRLEKCEKIC